MDPTTALTPDDIAAMTNALTLDDSADIARLRRVAASGKVGEEAGKEAQEKPRGGWGCTTALHNAGSTSMITSR